MRTFSYFIALCILNAIQCFSQQHTKTNLNQLKALKLKFYANSKIGTDSALYYMDKLANTSSSPYKTFAFAAQAYLKTRDKYPINFQSYSDSIQKYLPQIKDNNQNYSLLFDIYIILGNTSKRRGEMKAALDFYLKAESYALIINDIERIVKIKGNVALINQDMGQLDDALRQINITLKIVENNKKILGKNYNNRLYKTLLNKGAIYNSLLQENETKLYYGDSAIHCLNRILTNESLTLTQLNYGSVYSKLATAYTLKKEYQQANPFFQKSIEYFNAVNSQSNLYNSYYNMGVNYWKQDSIIKSKKSFWEVLSIKKDTLLDPNFVNTHKYLSEIYVKQKSEDSASYYFTKHQQILKRAKLEQEIEFDKIYSEDETYRLKKKIESLKKANVKSKNLFTKTVIALIIIVLISTYIILKNIKEKKNAKNRLQSLLDNSKEETKETTSATSISIKNEHHLEVIEGLKKIEKSLFFLKEEFNLYTTAKKIGTNTTYLSKIIKDHKKMTFSEYTNELRIKYIVEKLNTDKTIRAYTTQAIGEIGGYKNAKSFTRIFKKYTGITPYQFIEKIETEL